MASWTPEKRYRHKVRGGVYRLMGSATLQTSKPLTDNAEVVVYFGDAGECYVQPMTEFFDGQFEALPSSLKRKGKVACP